jgi:hypothetical protein
MRQMRPGSPEAAHATMKLVPLLVDEGKLDEARTRLNSLPPETDPAAAPPSSASTGRPASPTGRATRRTRC